MNGQVSKMAEAVAGVIKHRREQAERQGQGRAPSLGMPSAAALVESAYTLPTGRNPHAAEAGRLLGLTESERLTQKREYERKRLESVLKSGHFPKRAVIAAATAASSSFTGDEQTIPRLMALLEGGGIVVLIGDNGVGKTVLATMLAVEWIKGHAGTPAKYSDAGLYIGQMRHDCFGRKATSEGEWINDETRVAGLLVLDELDKTAELDRTTTSTYMLERVLKARHDAADRPTILIANYTDDALREHLPKSIRDRVAQGGDVVAITGASWRRLNAPAPVLH